MANPQTGAEACSRLDAWRAQIAAFSFPRWQELPEIDLYMDQVVGYLSQKLAVFYDTDDESCGITATMINNYVKQKVIAPPVKKRYDRAAVSSLMMLFCAKQVLSIGLCGELIAQYRASGAENAALHDRFCTVFEQVLHCTVSDADDLSALSVLRREDRTLTATAIAFANQIYAERQILQYCTEQASADAGGDGV